MKQPREPNPWMAKRAGQVGAPVPPPPAPAKPARRRADPDTLLGPGVADRLIGQAVQLAVLQITRDARADGIPAVMRPPSAPGCA